ncbi:hypothetical protein TTHERM_00474490 (macronuclear) [Tetrahymena thermophila SB210]|uniref:Uncharacterized protein n=1 Tax=Tetrahymena thermophila (strain SB210) TaxID=312017 RepID=I7M3L5_TETTS|nr:hypothetical protein TTHERM_00474490 [Tetrahymena thermophila SB210]EAS03688.2 hypothetical protein TTHERM_00474490 [Tetrahymena thermophila SB210]|eukprot:XP_001023933.2 hypothetical protein TTHERM_00474490 [Tetrahymena thermophila SB210]
MIERKPNYNEILSPRESDSKLQKCQSCQRPSNEKIKKANLKERAPSHNSIANKALSNSYSQRYKNKQSAQNNSVKKKNDQQQDQHSQNLKQALQAANLTYAHLKKRDKMFPIQNSSQNEQKSSCITKTVQSQNQIKQKDGKAQSQKISQNQISNEKIKDTQNLKLNSSTKDSRNLSLHGYTTPQNKNNQMLIYNKTLYKNDESFPTKDEISQKIADLVLKNINSKQKYELVQQYSAHNPVKEKKANQQIELEKEVQMPLDSSQKNQFKDLVKQINNQLNTLMSDENIKILEKSKNFHLNIQDITKTVSFYHINSSKLNSEQNMLSQRASSSQEKIQIQKCNTIQNNKNNQEEDSRIIFNKLFTSIDEIDTVKNATSFDNRRRSGSSGSPKFNEMRKKKKQMKTSIEKNKKQSEQQQFKSQIHQIQKLQDLIEPNTICKEKQYINSCLTQQDSKSSSMYQTASTNRNQNTDIDSQFYNKIDLETQISENSPNYKKINNQFVQENQKLYNGVDNQKNGKFQSLTYEKTQNVQDCKQSYQQNQKNLVTLKQKLDEQEKLKKSQTFFKKSADTSLKTLNTEYNQNFFIAEILKKSQSYRNQSITQQTQKKQLHDQDQKKTEQIIKYLQSPTPSKKNIYEQIHNTIIKQKIQEDRVKRQNVIK